MAYYKENIVKSKLKCRKCGSKDLRLIEIWTSHTIVWQQVSGEFDRNDGDLHEGNPHYVEAQCKNCSHQWKPKNCPQIDYVIKDLFN